MRQVIVVLVALALVGGAFGPAHSTFPHAFAQEDAATPTVAEPLTTGDAATEGEQPPPAVNEQPDEPTEALIDPPPVTDLSPSPGEGTLDDVPPSDEMTAAPADETMLVEETIAPSLTYALAGQPRCLLADGQPAIVAHGGFLDYDCAADVHLSGAHLAPAAVQLDWTVAAGVDGGWSVQLLPPAVDPNMPPNWTVAGSAIAEFAHRGGIGAGASTDALDAFETTATLTFGVRAHRVICGTEARPLAVEVAVAALLPGLDAATIADAGIAPEPYTLRPELAPIPEPSIAFGGALDFGEVRVDATGVLAPPTPQTIDVTVSGLDQACGEWTVRLDTTTLGGDDGSTIAASTLHLVSINDDALAEGGCPLEGGCEIAVLRAGAASAPATTFTLGVSLVLPDQPRATTFNSTLTATLADASSDS
ncbi:MAG: hypothetical protein ACRDJW_22155 [Thermomicrobiales bacterium]